MTTRRQLTPAEITELLDCYAKGASKRELARGWNVSRNAVNKFIQRQEETK